LYEITIFFESSFRVLCLVKHFQNQDTGLGLRFRAGSANSFGCRSLSKIPDFSSTPEWADLLRSQSLTNTGAFALLYFTLFSFSR